MKKLITILFIYTSLCYLSCKEKCGCENDPEMKITDTEVLMVEYSGESHLIKYDSLVHEICNKNIIPKDLLDSLKKVGTTGFKVKVTANIFPFCKDGRRVVGPFMKIEKIEELK